MLLCCRNTTVGNPFLQPVPRIGHYWGLVPHPLVNRSPLSLSSTWKSLKSRKAPIARRLYCPPSNAFLCYLSILPEFICSNSRSSLLPQVSKYLAVNERHSVTFLQLELENSYTEIQAHNLLDCIFTTAMAVSDYLTMSICALVVVLIMMSMTMMMTPPVR